MTEATQVDRKPHLTVTEVLLMRELYKKGWRQMDLAARFGVSQPHVSKILRGFKWPKVSTASVPTTPVVETASSGLPPSSNGSSQG